tara:strand:- start:100 stop:432 length:333 start_codon:yes stop_codon:yes gene_type:complete
MDVRYHKQNNGLSIKLLIKAVLSIIFMLLTANLSEAFITDFDRFDLEPVEQQAYVIANVIGLPLLCLIISQLLIEFRGIRSAVNSVYFSSLLMMAAQVPVLFYMASQSVV